MLDKYKVMRELEATREYEINMRKTSQLLGNLSDLNFGRTHGKIELIDDLVILINAGEFDIKEPKSER